MFEDEYAFPEIYEAEYGTYQSDFNVFLGIKNTGMALDLACGTGRITRALAESGLEVIGIDASGAILSFAKKKSENFSIQYVQQDMRSFNLDRKFDLITLAGNSFQALLSEQGQGNLLECVKSHLKPKGIFAFNTRTPTTENLATTESFEFWHAFHDLYGEEVQVYGKQAYDEIKRVMTYHTKRIWKNHETTSVVSLKFNSPEEIFRLLEKHGFKTIDSFGSTDRTPYVDGDKNLYVISQLV